MIEALGVSSHFIVSLPLTREFHSLLKLAALHGSTSPLALHIVGKRIIGDELTRECEGVTDAARAIGHNYSVTKFMYFHIFYELVMECTLILARDSDGKLWHGRNMDIGGLCRHAVTVPCRG